MKTVAGALLGPMLLLVVAGCSATPATRAVPPSAPPAAQAPAPSEAEAADAGLCRSVSVALNTLQGARAGYETGALDRRAFNYVVGVVVSDFDLLAVLHQDSTLRSAAQKLASSVHELGVTAEAPDFGDTSELAQRTAPIGERCTAVGAPLSLTG